MIKTRSGTICFGGVDLSEEPKKHIQWGGRREGSGRKPIVPEGDVARAMITLPLDELAYLKNLGDGSTSRGILKLIEWHREQNA